MANLLTTIHAKFYQNRLGFMEDMTKILVCFRFTVCMFIVIIIIMAVIITTCGCGVIMCSVASFFLCICPVHGLTFSIDLIVSFFGLEVHLQNI